MSAMDSRERKLKDLEGTTEHRTFAASLEVREAPTGSGLKLTGYAATSETTYRVADFAECITRGAWKRSLSENPDVVLNVNHGAGGGLPLARTRSGTLSLSEDARGLRVEADLDRTDPDVQALLPKLRRADVSEMSFAFKVVSDSWNKARTERTIREIQLNRGDVSLVTMAANPATEVSVRSRRGGSRGGGINVALLRERTAVDRSRLAVLRGRSPLTRPTTQADDPRRPRPRYSQLEIEAAAKVGLAWQDGRGQWVCIKDGDDVKAAIGAVSLEPVASKTASRRKIMAACRKVGLAVLIPKNWNSDGSLGGRSAEQATADRRYRYRLEGEKRDKVRHRLRRAR